MKGSLDGAWRITTAAAVQLLDTVLVDCCITPCSYNNRERPCAAASTKPAFPSCHT